MTPDGQTTRPGLERGVLGSLRGFPDKNVIRSDVSGSRNRGNEEVGIGHTSVTWSASCASQLEAKTAQVD